ncbi:molybdopterin molybdotransferase MoeA [Atopomonas sediminilitoris]|uniref:molybdopterin molybdotransferase MoeA n=1 Tax=Atopomonas sediminilitoris TaxID=2919919 RepID=UPI001F4DF3B1|nr:gephyrin-like molybdotransferase Glp [Atopomonas sediminilitoris]MCJ8170742.1 molybdopterin molybdotransferase MoeA [Atopomonas sediminilitoris]
MSDDCCARGHLTPVEQALAQLRERAQGAAAQRAVVQVPLLAALNRVLAQDVYADIDVPQADNSAMDGYAVRAADCQVAQALPVSQRVAAGYVAEPLQAGTCARIFTGAEIPPGADAVVMQEDAELQADGTVLLPATKAGSNVRPRGQDIQTGALLLAQGRRLRHADLGLLASVGVAHVAVYAPLRVAIVSSGDELLEPGATLTPGKLFNSNRYTLQGVLAGFDFELIDGGILPDDHALSVRRLGELAAQADVLISSGGVSVGEEDHLKAALQEQGELLLWKLAIKPGKPLAFGQLGQAAYLGLPGNPVAVLVTALVAGVPFLRWLEGEAYHLPVPQYLPTDRAGKAGKRREYLRVQCVLEDGQARLQSFANQSSGVLSSVSWAHGLAWQEVGQEVAVGDRLPFISFAQWLA